MSESSSESLSARAIKAVACGECDAEVGSPCVSLQGNIKPHSRTHAARMRAYSASQRSVTTIEFNRVVMRLRLLISRNPLVEGLCRSHAEQVVLESKLVNTEGVDQLYWQAYWNMLQSVVSTALAGLYKNWE